MRHSTEQKYLYLTKMEWAKSWTKGGFIPLFLASKYLSNQREGIHTPDENLVYKSNVDLELLEPAIRLNNVKNFSIGSATIDGRLVATNVQASRYQEDGVVLSLCNRKSADICRKLNKMACVRIHDVHALKRVLDDQMGSKSLFGVCKYTNNYERDHFLKSEQDSWQDEYRLFWPNAKPKDILLPRGMAKRVTIIS